MLDCFKTAILKIIKNVTPECNFYYYLQLPCGHPRLLSEVSLMDSLLEFLISLQTMSSFSRSSSVAGLSPSLHHHGEGLIWLLPLEKTSTPVKIGSRHMLSYGDIEASIDWLWAVPL